MNLSTFLIILASITYQPKYSSCKNVTAGNFIYIYDPSVGEVEQQKWYINDHTFIKDKNNTWHLFGITHPEPADPHHEVLFAHATAPHLSGPWIRQDYALRADNNYFGENHLWAPHVIQVNETYYMFYNGGGPDHTKYAISLATSKDLYNWTRLPSGPLFRDGWEARDPMVIKVEDLWHLFYCATYENNNVVAYRTSNDLINWSEKHIAFTDTRKPTKHCPTESPFVVHENNSWYLFTGPRDDDYRKTGVFRSQSPTSFTISQQIGEIHSHAAEVINDGGKYWISHCGWAQGGVYLAPLYFDN